MKKMFTKLFRGYFVLVTLVALFLSATLLFQSCSNENYYEEDSSIDRTAQIQNFKNSIKSFNVTNKSKSPTSKVSQNDAVAVEFVQSIEQEALMLIKSYGVTEQEIISEFGSLDPGRIALTAQLIVAEEELIDQGKTLSIFAEEDYSVATLSLLGMNSVTAQSDTVGGCIADAIGITAAFEIVESGIAGLGRQGVLKLVRKIGGKYLGAVGLILAAYDFADCMGWLTQVGGPLPGSVSSCNDLVMIDRISTSFRATYFISKQSINYKSQDNFKIERHQLYKVYKVNFGSFQNPECKVSYGNETVNGTHLDVLTVREINNGYVNVEL